MFACVSVCVCVCFCFCFCFPTPKHGNIVLDQGTEGDICAEDRGGSGGKERIVQ